MIGKWLAGNHDFQSRPRIPLRGAIKNVGEGSQRMPTLDELPQRLTIKNMARKKFSKRNIAFWTAYAEIRRERVPLVDNWSAGCVTWHPRVVEKMLWYSGTPNTLRNRSIAYDWLMQNCARFDSLLESRANRASSQKVEDVDDATLQDRS